MDLSKRRATILDLTRRLDKIEGRTPSAPQPCADPVAYCRDVLGVRLTPIQEEIARAIAEPPYKVLVRAGHNVGKTFLAACLVNWWYDRFDPGICLTTAPTERQVSDLLWKEVRRVRGSRGGFPGPKICRLESGPTHFAAGFKAGEATRFQGHHERAVLIVFDEAEGIGQEFWETALPMLQGDHYGFLAIYNPTTQAGPTVDAERQGGYRTFQMSCLDHPNLAAELAGRPPPYPSAARLATVRDMLRQWSQPGDGSPGDVQLGNEWFRPGPVAQARLLGIRPTTAFDSVWSEWIFDLCCSRALPEGGPLQIGCDVARFGDDDSCWHVRRGGNSLDHQSANGLDVVQVAGRCKQLAHAWGRRLGIDHRRVVVAVDDCGVGGGVTDLLRADGYTVAGVNAAGKSPNEEEYPNLRSCLWFALAETAALGNVSFAALPEPARAALRRELLAPTYVLDVRGRRVVEPKDKTKARLGRSPDNADAVLLAYANVAGQGDTIGGRVRVA